MRRCYWILFLVWSFSFGQLGTSLHKYDPFIQTKPKDFDQIDSVFNSRTTPIEVIQYVFDKSKAFHSNDIEAFMANRLGIYYRNISKYKLAVKYHQYALALSKKIKNKSIEVQSYNMLGVVYRRMEKIIPAIDNHQKALSIIENMKGTITHNFIVSKAISLNSLGNIYLSLNQNELALETFQKSLNFEIESKNLLGIAINYQNIGGVYENLNQLDLAKKNYEKSLAYNQQINSEIGLMICKNSLGIILLKQNKPKEAFNYIFPTIQIAKKTEDDFYISSSYINLGWAYQGLNQLDKAKENITIGLKIAQKDNFLSSISLCYEILSEIAEKENNFKLANQYIKQYHELDEEISGGKTQKYMFELISKYENDKKETLIKTKDNEIKINKLNLANKEKQKRFYLLGLIGLFVIGSLFFYQSYSRKKTNQKLQLLNTELDVANQSKVRFFNILNHDLRSPVANLIHFLHLQKENPELLDTESKNRLEQKTIKGAENLLHSMEDILLWSKSQMHNFNPSFKPTTVDTVFNEVKNHFASVENVRIEFENPENIELNTDENYLKTIVRNLTGNAIKAIEKVDNGSIIWKAWHEDKNTFLSITDNGFGGTIQQFNALFDDAEKVGIKSGLGLHLIRDLAKQIQCQIMVDTQHQNGTTITLVFLKKG
jgi:signal transduction histidine kinase/Tfp pilus assembly protein PilF